MRRPDMIVAWMMLLSMAFTAFPAQVNVGAIPASGWGIAGLVETDDSGNAMNPQVAFDAEGNALAIWIQYDGVRTNLWSNRYTKDIGWGAPGLVERENQGPVNFPDLAVAPDGNAIAVWDYYTGVTTNIRSCYYSSGFGWGPIMAVEIDDTGEARHPQVVIDDSGNATAVWRQYDGAVNDILSNRYVKGVGWGTAQPIETNDVGSAEWPRIAMDSAGNAVAVWGQADAVRINIWSNRYLKGFGWGTAELIETDDSGFAMEHQVAVDHNGNAIAVWVQYGGLWGNICSNRFTAGSGWGAAQVLDTEDLGDAFSPQIAFDPDGNAIAIWDQRDEVNFNIWSNRYTAGVGWGMAELIETDDKGHAEYPQVATDPFGNAVTVWHQHDGNTWNIYSNRYSASTGWGVPELLETNFMMAESQQIDVDDEGNAMAIWVQVHTSTDNIWANRYVMPDITPPSLVVSSSPEGPETDLSTAIIFGTTEPGATVDVTGVLATVSDNGSFRVNIALLPGGNPIKVTATDPSGNLATATIFLTYNDPVEDLKEDITTLTNMLSSLDTRMYLAEDDIEALDSIVEVLKEDDNLTDEDIAFLLENITLLKGSLNNTPGINETVLDMLGSLEGRLNGTVDQIGSVNDEMADIQDEQEALRDDMDRIEEELGKDDEEPKDLTALVIGLFVVNLILVFFLLFLILVLFIVKKGKGDKLERELEE